MAGQTHVLLIGIDAYDGDPKFSLNGCVNDIDAVQKILVEKVGVPAAQVTRLVAPRSGVPHRQDDGVQEAPPTLEEIRSALARLGSKEVVKPEDSVFVYYSGHGTQLLLQDAKKRTFSREALVPTDRERFTKPRFLFDWELNKLLADIAGCTSAVTVILDCCCGAGALRSVVVDDPRPAAATAVAPRARFWATPEIVQLEEGTSPPSNPLRGVARGVASLRSCQLVAACLDTERARESVGTDQRAQGELTRALVRQLEPLTEVELADLRWGRIWRAVLKDVRDANPRQSPWMSGSFARRVFGAGGDEPADTGFAVRVDDDGYHVDAGTLSGVSVGAEISVYGDTPALFPPLGSGDDDLARKGRVSITHADRSAAGGVAVAPFTLPVAARGRLTRAGRQGALRLALLPEDAALAAALRGSPFIELVPSGTDEVSLERRADGAWALTDELQGTGEDPAEPSIAVIPASSLGVIRSVVEHYHRYIAPARMAAACLDLPTELSLLLLDCNGVELSGAEAQSPDLPLVKPGPNAPYSVRIGDQFCFAVDNTATAELSVWLFDCGASGRVSEIGHKRMPPLSRHAFWAGQTLGAPFGATLPAGVDVCVDRIVAIATTRADLSLAYLETSTAFEDLIHPRRTRGELRTIDDRARATPPEQWTSATTVLRIERGVRPGGAALRGAR